MVQALISEPRTALIREEEKLQYKQTEMFRIIEHKVEAF
jgi:hypothetical protein